MKRISYIFSGIAVCCVLFFTLFSCASNYKSVSASENIEYTSEISVEQGKVIGKLSNDGKVEIFAGIPYAKAPVGDLRWKAPRDPENWDKTLIAATYAPMSMQKRSGRFTNWLWRTFALHDKKNDKPDFAPMSEDCLYLNIWKPAGECKDLPVMVYIHGGSLVSGNSYSNLFDGENMARQGIIRVNIDYRTGIFGFFATDELVFEDPNRSAGNYGLMDQIKALEWVKKNIAAFGGNPDNVTIAGESAGSSCVSALCASPAAKGLFKNAIGTSSSVVVRITPHTFYTFSQVRQKSYKTMVQFEATTIADMRKIPAEKLLKSKYRFDGMTVDGYILPDYPWNLYQKGIHNEENLLQGYNEHEGYAFSFALGVNKKKYPKLLEKAFPGYAEPIIKKYPAEDKKQAIVQYDKIFGANAFGYSHYMWGKAAMQNNVNVYQFFFTKENGGISSNHSGELMYSYRNVPRGTKNYDESDFKLEEIMSSYWINFAKSGNPNGSDTKGNPLPEWPSLNKENDKVLQLGSEVKVIDEPNLELYPLLKAYRDTLKPGEIDNWDPRS
ncbi:MAG: carboxylesterase family protein [Treponemataceae bacterium]|nr:carboxylesterase family protein [Treponemataceae bacterium]